jgi:dihydrodipicolinate synthase/N-acetylneuraminate lyase
MPEQTTAPFRGVFPVAPTPFLDNGDIDFEGQKRVLDCMIDQKVDGICILANYSEQFSLTDAERTELVELCLGHVGGRVPVIVTCSHFSTRIAAERAALAARAGADMVMLMPPYHGNGLRADTNLFVEHFSIVSEAAGIPIMYQDAPLSGVSISPEGLADLAKTVPNVRYFKIEVPFAAAKLRNLIAAGAGAIDGPFDGEESITLMADLDAGATGTMCSALLPELVREVVIAHKAGDRQGALRHYNRILPLINHENRQCGLRAAKAAMAEGKVIRSEHVRHPLDVLHPQTRAGLIELGRELDLVSFRWGH